MNSVRPITQRLRDIEVAYTLHATHSGTIHKARQLINALWKLNCDPQSDIRAEAKKLFEKAGLKTLTNGENA